MNKAFFFPGTFLLVAALLLAGCAGSPQVRFYALTPLEQPGPGFPPSQAEPPPSVTIAPIEIPDYLDRPQIVTREGENALTLAEFDRWAGSLRDNMSTVLMENLSVLLGSKQIFVHPRIRTEQSDYLLALRVLRLDCTPGDQVLLKAQWTIFPGQNREGMTEMATLTEPLADSRYETLAAAVSRVLARLSVEIAGNLRQGFRQ
jgi:uncharacterized lipoprotein YmbA